MLGDRRSNSLFAASPSAAPAEPGIGSRPGCMTSPFEEDPRKGYFCRNKVAPKRVTSSSLPRTKGMPSLRRFSMGAVLPPPTPMPP